MSYTQAFGHAKERRITIKLIDLYAVFSSITITVFSYQDLLRGLSEQKGNNQKFEVVAQKSKSISIKEATFKEKVWKLYNFKDFF